MSLPIYQRVAVTDAGDVIPGAEYTVINENTGVAAPIYSDRTGATLLTPPYFADSVGTIQFFIAQGTTFRVAASGGVGTYTDRYVYGVAEAVLVNPGGGAGLELFNNTGGGTALNFRPSIGDSQKYNMSITSYDHDTGGTSNADGLSINGIDGVSICTGSSTTRQERFFIDSNGIAFLNSRALVDSGTGFVKYADGTMICYGKSSITVNQAFSNQFGSTSGTSYRSNFNFTYAQTFSAPPVVTASGAGISSVVEISIAPSTTSCVMYPYTTINGTNITVFHVATGRWF